MRKIAAVAFLTVRAAVHSRVVAAAAVILVIITIGLPFIMKGDGTSESLFFIFINYSFGLQMFVLALVATWCGAGAISLEVSNRQMQLLTVKPLRTIELWTGKLLGLMAINFVLLALGGALLYVMLQFSLSSAEAHKTSHKDLRREIMTVYCPISSQKTANQPYSPIAIGPGQKHLWRFNLHREKNVPFALIKFRFLPSPFSYQSPVSGDWRAGTEKNKNLFSNTIAASPHMVTPLYIPQFSTPCQLAIEYCNLQTNPAVTVFFPSENDMRLLVPRSSFEANFLRALIMAFARLCFFSSLGLIAGTLFSFPVAVFVSMGLLILALSGNFVRQIAERGILTGHANENLSPFLSILNEAARGAFQFFAAIIPPLARFDPLAFLPNSLFIPWNLAGQSVAVLCGLYSLILILLGAFCLTRRETGLPAP